MSTEGLLNKSIHFSSNERILIQQCTIPRHVAIIMDGNRRWAKQQKANQTVSLLDGHWAGVPVLTQAVEAAYELGIKVLTVFGFSTENWFRPPKEVETLLRILTLLEENTERMVSGGVKLHIIGDISPFPKSLQEIIRNAERATEKCQGIDLAIALNYGSRDEIKRAMLAIMEDVQKGVLQKESISESLISSYLDTSTLGDVDLLIRTSGEMRISNFLLWQLAYAEIYITDVLWPEFTPRDLLQAVLAFQTRQRRIGR